MTISQKEFRNKLIQEAYDYYIYNNKFQPDYYYLNRLYNYDFCKSLAEKTLVFIKNQVLKEVSK